jgi:hypothetical protein
MKCFKVAHNYLSGFRAIPAALVVGNHDLEGEEFETDEDNLAAWSQVSIYALLEDLVRFARKRAGFLPLRNPGLCIVLRLPFSANAKFCARAPPMCSDALASY